MRLPSLNAVVNVVLLAVALLIGGLHIQNYLQPRQSGASQAARPSLVKGTTAPLLAGINYADATRTVVLFVHSQCQYCTDSMPFYARLASIKGPGGRLIAASREDQERARTYLDRHQVRVDAVVSIGKLDDARFAVTPTVVAVSSAGIVEGVWTGLLDATRQREVQAALQSDVDSASP